MQLFYLILLSLALYFPLQTAYFIFDKHIFGEWACIIGMIIGLFADALGQNYAH